MRSTDYMLLLVACLSMAGYLLMPRVGGHGRARMTAAGADINGSLKSALGQYQVDVDAYPSNLEALIVAPGYAHNWHGPYLDNLPVDPWGNAYVYHFPGHHNTDSYDLLSVGPDGKEGTEDDVVNWQGK